jgi:hypothetical protein
MTIDPGRTPKTRARTVDDATLRDRCISTEAAEYTLYVRRLIDEHYGSGGQAKIRRTAERKGIAPAGATRQWLSEQISGRYRHGPPWTATDLIIECLPDTADRPVLRARAQALYQAARQYQPRSRHDIRPDNAGPRRGPAPVPPREQRRANSANLYRRPTPDRQRHGDELQAAREAQSAAEQRAAQAELRATVIRAVHLSDRARLTSATEVVDLRERCALMAVRLQLAGEAAAYRDGELADVVATLAPHDSAPFTSGIDPSAPLPHRLLAAYLCSYADLAGGMCTELAHVAGLDATRIADILSARGRATDSELTDLIAALGAVSRTAWTLAGAAVRHELRSHIP